MGVSRSKPLNDEIDCVLVRHYGFTEEELDSIPSIALGAGIDYDINCRMGRDAESGDE